MTLSRRKVLAGAAAGSLLLAGCGDGAGEPRAGASSVDPGTLSGEIVVLNPGFGVTEQKKVWNSTIESFNAIHPNVKVTTDFTDFGKLNEKLTVAIAGGLLPDVVMTGVGWIPPYAAKGLYAEFDPAMVAGRDYTERVLAPCRYDDKLYAIPLFLDTRCMIANNELLRKAGIAGPPKSFAELREAAKELTGGSGSGKQWGIMINTESSPRQTLATLLGANNASLFSPDGRTALFDAPEAVECLQLLLDLIADGSTDWNLKLAEGSAHPFLGGKIAMTTAPSFAGSTWPKGNAELLKEENSTLFRVANKRESIFLGGTLLSRAAESKNGPAADAFIRFLTDVKPVTALCEVANTVPPLSEALAGSQALSANRFIQAGVEGLEFASSEGGSSAWLEIRGQVDPILEEALLGKLSAEAAMQKAQKLVQAVLDQQ